MTLQSVAGLLGFFGVALGAFGAHGLKGRVPPEMLEVWKTGVLYHLVHAGILLMIALLPFKLPLGRAVAGCFLGGIVVFSGTLYALVLTGQGWLGAVTPIGGGAFLVGWLLLAVGGFLPGRSRV